ncbi:MAG: class I SAM-dependent methyltransferase [Candidatus Rokubacteria bacterium]|nr:class I SAM-dependent methyltransferase [Candidatus Rokubacteria bacterium]
MIAYFSPGPTRSFWEDHWAGHTLEELLGEARRSPLTGLIEAALPPRGRVLEAGCGLGQYVLLFRERGRRAVGVDRTFEPLRECRKASPGAPVALMDLRCLGFRPGAFSAYVSLGVVEHDPEGPDAILREARRVLEPGGVLILSVPYLNGVRRLGTWWIRLRNRRVRAAGGEFYQFAFSRREVRAFLERNGFRVRSLSPYDPARLLRKALGRVVRPPHPALSPRGGEDEGEGIISGVRGAEGARFTRAGRRLLYTPPLLRLLGHMILFVAVKAE